MLKFSQSLTKVQKLLLPVIALFLWANVAQAQQGIGVTNPDPSSALEISSTSKGILFPRMTTAQRNAIVTPADGLMIYNTTTGCINTFKTVGGWKSACDANDIGMWGLLGNTGTIPGTNFIGTKDLIDFVTKTNDTERMRVLGTNGRVGIGTATPLERLHIYDAADSYLKIDGPGAAGKGIMLANAGTNEWLIRRPAATNYLGFFDASISAEAMTIFAGGNVGIGLNATAPTNKLHISATANPIRLEGLQGGVNGDSLVTTDANGVLRKRTVASVMLSGNTWLNGGNALTSPGVFGTTTNQPFSIITNNVTSMTFAANGAITQGGTAGSGPQVTFTGNVDATNGLDVTGAPLTANAGATLTGVVNLNTTGGGTTNIGNCVTPSTTNIAGPTNINTACASPTLIGNAAATTTVIGAVNLNNTGTGITTIGNAAGTTNITGPTVNVTGLVGGSGADSVVVQDPVTGRLKKVSMAMVGANAFTANNGLTKTASNVQLGGTLIQATTVTLGANNLNFATNSTGNVGVNAASPTSRLAVNGSFATAISTKTGNYTATIDDHIIIADATAGDRTITLPTAVGIAGRQYIIKKKDASANRIIIAADGTDTIDGAFNIPLSIQWQVRTIVSDGANWMIISNQ